MRNREIDMGTAGAGSRSGRKETELLPAEKAPDMQMRNWNRRNENGIIR